MSDVTSQLRTRCGTQMLRLRIKCLTSVSLVIVIATATNKQIMLAMETLGRFETC